MYYFFSFLLFFIRLHLKKNKIHIFKTQNEENNGKQDILDFTE